MKIGLIGYGSIGTFLARGLKQEIAWVVDADPSTEKKMRAAHLRCPFFASVPKECAGADLVVEAASQAAVPMLVPCLKHADVMVMSVGALADRKLLGDMARAAEKFGRRIYIPSGAIGGLDAISAVSGKISSLTLETTKPPPSLGRNDKGRTVVFEGSAADACRLYPKNVNVSATLSLAGIGFEKTRVRIVSDPNATNNTHRIIVESPAGKMAFEFQNLPSAENPKTSALAALSALHRIKKINQKLQIG